MKKQQQFKKLVMFILCVVLLLGAFSPALVTYVGALTIAEQVDLMLACDHTPGVAIIGFTHQTSLATAMNLFPGLRQNGNTLTCLCDRDMNDPQSQVILIANVSESILRNVLILTNGASHVEYAEPEYISEIDVDLSESSSLYIPPTDPCLPYDPAGVDQWGLDMIGVSNAWSKGFVGNQEVRIGIMDTGVSYHPDLVDNVDFSLAYNAMNESSNVTDYLGHGTGIASIIAADLNGTGMTGICKNVRIIPIKIANFSYTSTALLRAVEYAIQNDIDILNFSFSLSDYESKALRKKVAQFPGLFVTSAGNSGSDMEDCLNALGKLHYDQNWIVVGASNSSDQRAFFSNYNYRYCDLFAPGEDIVMAGLNNTYVIDNGTSFAAPHVVAAMALIMSHATHLSPLEVKEYILASVDHVTAFNGLCVSNGRLNINKAVNMLYSEYRGAYTKGDPNGDGVIDAYDYMLVKEYCLNTVTFTATQVYAADVNDDGVIDAMDYFTIRSYILQMSYFPPV